MPQLLSIENPVEKRKVATVVVNAVNLADAMGLFPRDGNLDAQTVENLLAHLHRAGIGQGIEIDATDGESMLLSLMRLNSALEASPAPEFEWVRMEQVLGLDLLAKLVGISTVSIRRYLAKTRTTPDDVAARLHVLSLIVGDLNGAYNDAGIRQWFQRRRTQLDGKSPMELLVGAWRPDDEIVARLRALSGALVASPAT
jgi:hypothetical protein